VVLPESLGVELPTVGMFGAVDRGLSIYCAEFLPLWKKSVYLLYLAPWIR
jgi:hypothetical protein